MDEITRNWIRDAGDEKAAANGCKMDLLKGGWTVFWIERYCSLYEGEYAGDPLIFRGCHRCDSSIRHLQAIDSWDEALVLERANAYMECVKAGHEVDWQYEYGMRMFGWVRYSDRWKRWVRRFTEGSIWVPKKNKKSPTLAATGLYLLAGDGERGQKVFFAAKDGTQARGIAGKHAYEMLLQSAELQEECTSNMTTMQITHETSRSILLPLSSSNSSSQKSKQGLNGSLLVDETHVVDREFMNQINRMGISRSEPLVVEFSTAGFDPDGYGMERFNTALAVRDGRLTIEGFLPMVYAADQTLTDGELDRNLVEIARKANPAMGHTVEERELVADYNKSKSSLSNLLEFKMYRLNIWQRSANQWIKEADWDACYDERVSEDVLRGDAAWMALDMSQCNDLSSLVVAFPQRGDNEEVIVNLLFTVWCAQEMAEANAHQIPYLEWIRDGHLKMSPGRTIKADLIVEEVERYAKMFKVIQFNYDPRFAQDISDRVEFEVGLPVVKFPQTFAHFAGAIDKSEALVLEHNWRHNGNPCVKWQMMNAAVKNMPSGGKMIVKPEELSSKKVDSAVAAIMATRAAIEVPPPSNYYAKASTSQWMG